MANDLARALEYLELARERLEKYFRVQRINDMPRPERAGWAMTAIGHAMNYLEREMREMRKAVKE